MTAPAAAPAAALDTLPKLLLDNVRRRGARAAFREKDYGIWQQWTWEQAADEIRAFACGLAALGLKRGDKLTTVGDNRPRLYWAVVATQAIGGVPVPVYQDSVAAEMGKVLAHAGVRFAIAENQEQVDKLIEIKESCPELELIIYSDPRGLKHYPQPYLKSYAEAQEMGRAFAKANPDFFAKSVAQGAGGDIALIAYTSGTTGQSKVVMLTFANLIETARNAAQLDGL